MKIGIVGGGQLAMMMILNNPGHEYFVLDPNAKCSCHKIATIIAAGFSDEEAYTTLDELCDVITFEFENVDENCLEKVKHKLQPSVDVLKISKNRSLEKNFAKNNNINVTPFANIRNIYKLLNFVSVHNFPVIVKTTTNGYDGKGQIKINNFMQLMQEDVLNIINNTEVIVEKFIKFDFETSAIISRNKNKDTSFIPSTINIHQDQILRYTLTTNNQVIENKVQVATTKLADKLNLIGTLCAEYYVKGDEIYFNEMAPRVHNSGHHSTLSCSHNQFENAIKAVCNLPLEKGKVLENTIMVNLLGGELEMLKENLTKININSKYEIVDYLKPEIKDKRKRGHINLSNVDYEILKEDVVKISKLLGVNYEKILCS